MRGQAPVVASVCNSITVHSVTQQVLVALVQSIVTFLLDSTTQPLNNGASVKPNSVVYDGKTMKIFSWLGSFFIADIFVMSVSAALLLVFPVVFYSQYLSLIHI